MDVIVDGIVLALALGLLSSGCVPTDEAADGGSGGAGGAGGAADASAGSGGTVTVPPSVCTTGEAAEGEMVPATDYCAPVSGWSGGCASLEEEVLRLLNENRAAGWDCQDKGQFGPAGPLAMNPTLRCSARLHSVDMSARRFTGHTNPDGLASTERIHRAGYSGHKWAEDLAWGQAEAAEAVAWWMQSPTHCSYVMQPDFTEVGVGYFADDSTDPDFDWNHFWTLNFGAP